MRGDIRHLFPEDLVVPIHHVIEPVFPVHSHQRHAILVHKQESAVAVHHLFNLRSFPFLNDRTKTVADIIAHGEFAITRVGLGPLNHVLHIACPLNLMINVQDFVLQVNVLQRQTAELGNPQPSMEQDVHHLVILAVTIVIMDQ